MPPRAKKPRVTEDIDIDSLYEQCQSSDASIYKLEESGITSKIWNIFVSQENKEPKKVTPSYLEKASFILLRMIIIELKKIY